VVLQAGVDLPVDLTAPGHARAWLYAVLTAWGESRFLDTAQLLTSELVTNAIRYGGPPLHVQLTCSNHVLRVTVADSTPDGPRLRDPHPDAESGRGMLLVEALSVSWGVEPYKVGKGVWFEFPAG
jgi:anti-sigma regulatory factor (Ser/Thr protein kinase)